MKNKETFKPEERYTAWTRENSNAQWVVTVIYAQNKNIARIKLIEQGRQIEKGTLRKYEK